MHLPGSMPGVEINAAIKNLFKKLVWENIGHRRRYYMCGIAGFYQSHFDYLTKKNITGRYWKRWKEYRNTGDRMNREIIWSPILVWPM